MILEYPSYVSDENINIIKSQINPFIGTGQTNVYNRDGKTVNITKSKGLKKVDEVLQGIFGELQEQLISRRYRPIRGSSDQGYEYHKYDKNQVCHYHIDGELSGDIGSGCLLRYASVILHLNTINKGGELVFPAQNKSIKTERGKIIVFPPYGTHGHYTTPSPEVREIIVTWFVYSDLIIRNI